ncbi:hypothetical protein NAEGRDRAFT_35386 [Naegleria gruberi]|uniref:Actin n=1 Tax=Naegleria gruberi TaxID=5762 RepID=D2V3F0_NAEGR|nr:uncharacterized protein NAEGRDRAFT_35386 [Naegleria gruberi]EFC48626.1 hypothetical protein NAEGRDRAFT_35386 [Naegleria gruberi]|eukprot:XP_002681370.1 hypothetical protein NAEGRDRAFT_35386 [Naegleria gruberi strain NEG-M]
MEIDYSYNTSNPIQSQGYYTSYQIIPNLKPSIVIDNGSGILKSGFANQDFPICVFNNMIGRLKQYSATRGVGIGGMSGMGGIGDQGKKLYFGDGAQSLRGVLQLSYPVERGIVKNFDDFEMMLQYTQDCLKLETFSENPLLITESTINPKQNRERITQMMFETFDVPYLYMAKSPVLSLFAHGYTTGLVLDSGDGVTHTVPIYEGYSLPHAVQRLELAGKDLTNYMLNLLNQSGQSKPFQSQNSSSHIEIVRCLKEDLSFVKSFNDSHNSSSSNTINNNNSSSLQVNYDLPDGTSIKVGEERFKCPELLFNPSIVNGGSEMLGVHELCKKTIYECDIDLRKTLASNIFLSGGSTKFNGFQSRLQDEIQNLLPYSNKVKVKGSKDVQFLPWIGGSIISKISRFPYDCISRQEYEETGPYYCHVKFM